MDCPLRAVNEPLSQVQEFEYPGVLFTSEGIVKQ